MTALPPQPAQADVPAPKTFADMGVDDRICAALADSGIVTPFPIQELTLPLGLSGADLIGQARTGTGKTLAFGIPLLQRVDAGEKATQALVVVPTRELCMQVRDDLERAGARTDARIVAVYGGKAIDPQTEALARGAPVVVGTPGRLLDLRRRGALDLSAVTTLVLDEADEMLDLGFLPDVEQLIQATHESRQTLLFSATMPSPVVALARRYMRKPTFLRADVEESRIAPETRQYFFACHPMDKAAVLARILQAPGRGLCLAFTRTKRMADKVAADLRDRGIAAAAIHSDLRQEARERAMARFRSGEIDLLVATEVAARGLDITDVTHVVNYDCPDDEKMYLHRIGRTGRAGAAGAAVTLAVWHEQARLEVIKKALGIDEPTHELFSTSPILDELFDLPAQPDRPRIPSEPSPRGGSRGGSRRGGRGQREAPKQRTPPADRTTSDADTGSGGSRRVRRRRRSASSTPAGGDQSTAPDSGERPDTGARGETRDAPGTRDRAETRDTPDAGERPANGAGGSRAQRTRTRRRTRRGTPAQTPADATAQGAGHGERDEPSRAPADPGPEAGTGARPTAGARGGDESPPDDERPEGRQRRQSAPRDGSAPRGGRRGRRSGRRPAREAAASPPPASRQDTGNVRGTGRPRLTRPLSIAHLP